MHGDDLRTRCSRAPVAVATLAVPQARVSALPGTGFRVFEVICEGLRADSTQVPDRRGGLCVPRRHPHASATEQGPICLVPASSMCLSKKNIRAVGTFVSMLAWIWKNAENDRWSGFTCTGEKRHAQTCRLGCQGHTPRACRLGCQGHLPQACRLGCQGHTPQAWCPGLRGTRLRSDAMASRTHVAGLLPWPQGHMPKPATLAVSICLRPAVSKLVTSRGGMQHCLPNFLHPSDTLSPSHNMLFRASCAECRSVTQWRASLTASTRS
eukprot:364033-Chlamydomonas_euryale.AAC.13